MSPFTPDKHIQLAASRYTGEELVTFYGQAVKEARKCHADALVHVQSRVDLYAAAIAERCVREEESGGDE